LWERPGAIPPKSPLDVVAYAPVSAHKPRTRRSKEYLLMAKKRRKKAAKKGRKKAAKKGRRKARRKK
jgi:hypothetical protein